MKRRAALASLLPIAAGVSTAILGKGKPLPESAVLRADLIFPLDDRPTPSCHASTFAQARDGQLVTAWFGGAREGADDVGIWVSRLENGRWTKPVEAASGALPPHKRFPCWNPVLFQPRQGPLILFYKVGPAPAAWWGEMKMSGDVGRTWAGHRRLPPDILGPIKNKPIQLGDGRILCPSSTEHAGWRVHVEITRDLEGWEVTGALNDPAEIEAIQPCILTHPREALQMLCRTRGAGRIAESWSRDSGRTWDGMTLLSLPNPNSGIDAVTLKDGRHVLVFNDTPRGRTPLNIAVSADGREWEVRLTLEDGPGEYSYPAVIQAADGAIHVTYTYLRQGIKHVVLDPAKL